ncbi:LuxR C-terminal-related transcriptional regulator [Pseudomonas guariconensis]|uniref:LuxR C-terminal-related transcriptional regulator n=1 Tax=Pseudomonas TaxID=286 RepID=UPI001CE4034E|nr:MULTISPECIES: LuxR C-terminal-related transcriptional regulator [Pseudomonas]MCO7643079.1 LuxR C-terminal-related transcriptional regulator [Pseudomonas sp. S 311-6]MCO7515278.1 LuxR C-terminal-related transcriptional regulator [Pseudomonas putida]MCO7567741.1 LuxR C-terminal-related transcriptional regulator [Pseudomonas mosselii]MCO7597357.1 LuxR C-terminal-related transcriptional regulator [Pseudomonas guariconensis]MCO7604262.1 LuxR C-terminal-related transcriptional regulator [Pseudomo
MQFWPLRTIEPERCLNIGQAAALLGRVGENHRRQLAGDLLQLIGSGIPLAQCTVFAYAPRRNPQVFTFADRAREVSLLQISSRYAERFYSQDGNQHAMACSNGGERIVVQRQRIDDIGHAEYRRICYEQPKIAERLALLASCDKGRWLSVNFYRGREHGSFSAQELDFMEASAPLLMQIVRMHYLAYLQANELPLLLTERLAGLYPELTLRDRELLRLLLSGIDNDEIAVSLGVRPSSAATYIKRLYRKLGTSGLRELIGLATQAGRWR